MQEDRKKYIVFEDGSAIVFPTSQIHYYMVGNKVPVSAGFVFLNEDGSLDRCFGESLTLDLKSRPEDIEILKSNKEKNNE